MRAAPLRQSASSKTALDHFRKSNQVVMERGTQVSDAGAAKKLKVGFLNVAPRLDAPSGPSLVIA